MYGLGENILFGTDKSQLQGAADARLQLIANSLSKRFKHAAIAIYGHTDSTGTPETNKVLGAERAGAVKDWLITKGGFAPEMISVRSVGETKPIANN
ncbi:MAG: OmpA family protein, partial [Chitinophagaceae bacterium]